MNLLNLILLALAAAIYPTLLAAVILILGRENPFRMLIAFFLGGLTVSLLAGFGIVKAIESSGAESHHHSTKPVLDIVVGAVSLLVAYGIWRGRITGGFIKKRRKTPREEATEKPSFASRTLGGDSVTMAAIAGLVLNVPGVWYLDALAGIAKAKPSTATVLLQLLLFNVIMLALVEIPILIYAVDPERATGLVTRLRDWAHRNARAIAIAVTAAVGLWLVIKGIVHL